MYRVIKRKHNLRHMSALIEEMMTIQTEVNNKVDKDWKSKEREWYRAACVECAELLDSIGYKWWKHSPTIDYENSKTELVDIFHFILSICIENHISSGTVALLWSPFEKNIVMSSNPYIENYDKYDKEETKVEIEDEKERTRLVLCRSIDHLMLAFLEYHYIDRNLELVIDIFSECCTLCDMTLEDLYLRYINKSVLNNFRQDNGYKEGTYIKDWNGKEDNEVLLELAASFDSSLREEINYFSWLYSQLQEYYYTKIL